LLKVSLRQFNKWTLKDANKQSHCQGNGVEEGEEVLGHKIYKAANRWLS